MRHTYPIYCPFCREAAITLYSEEPIPKEYRKTAAWIFCPPERDGEAGWLYNGPEMVLVACNEKETSELQPDPDNKGRIKIPYNPIPGGKEYFAQKRPTGIAIGPAPLRQKPRQSQ